MSAQTACSRNNEEYKKLLEEHKKFIENTECSLSYAKHFSKITDTPYKTVLRWCKSGFIVTEWIRILGRKNYIIAINKLPKLLKVKYLRALYKSYGIQTCDLAIARHQYNRLKMWGTTDLSYRIDQLQELAASGKNNQNNNSDLTSKPDQKTVKQGHELTVVEKQEESKEFSFTNELFFVRQGPEVVRDDAFQVPVISSKALTEKKSVSIVPGYLEGRESEKLVIEKTRLKACAKYTLIKKLNAYLRDTKACKGREKTKQTQVFLSMYNQGSLYPDIYAQLGVITDRSLRNWIKQLGNSSDYTLLMDNYKRKACSERRMTPEAARVLSGILLNSKQFDTASGYEYYVRMLEQQGISEIPSLSVCRRYVQDFRANRNDVWTFAREGQKALKDKVGDYTECDNTSLAVNQMWETDGNKIDCRFKDPVTSQPIRGIFQPFFDRKSCAIVGFEVSSTGNTDCVWSALRNSILNAGKTPDSIKVDNGKEVKNKQIESVLKRLFIAARFAKPYNARAKRIERFFSDFTSDFAKAMPTYTGNSIENKPAHMKRNELFHKQWNEYVYGDFVPTIDQMKEMIQWWIDEYYHKRKCPNVPEKTIGEVFEEGKGAGFDVRALDELMLYKEVRKASRCRVKLGGKNYRCDELYGLDKDVIVRYNPMDNSTVFLYDERGNFIGEAKAVRKFSPVVMYEGSEAEKISFKEDQRRQKSLEKKTREDFKKAINANHRANSKLPKNNMKIVPEIQKPVDNVIEIKTEEQKEYEYYLNAGGNHSFSESEVY
ncbi:MAG: Mu transposase C-terminal domain-containing protein [Cyanobacteriota bacterium]